jgi:hypothetical protein
VQSAFRSKQIAPVVEAVAEVEALQSKQDRVHDPDEDIQPQLITALRLKFGAARADFGSFSNEEGIIGKKEWRRLIKKALPTMLKAQVKALQKRLSKTANRVQFCELMGEEKAKDEKISASTSHHSPHLAQLPSEVPVLPTSFKSRPHAHEQLVAALLDSGGNRSTAVTAPKSRVSSQGIGGVGKTMLTAAWCGTSV